MFAFSLFATLHAVAKSIFSESECQKTPNNDMIFFKFRRFNRPAIKIYKVTTLREENIGGRGKPEKPENLGSELLKKKQYPNILRIGYMSVGRKAKWFAMFLAPFAIAGALLL